MVRTLKTFIRSIGFYDSAAILSFEKVTGNDAVAQIANIFGKTNLESCLARVLEQIGRLTLACQFNRDV